MVRADASALFGRYRTFLFLKKNGECSVSAGSTHTGECWNYPAKDILEKGLVVMGERRKCAGCSR